jgi:uncharacterized protein with HEPN domain
MPGDRDYLLDVLQAARLALDYVRGRTREEFLQDAQFQDAVIRRLEIIGEAVRRVSHEARTAHPTLPWHDMVSMRNVLIHDYDDVDFDIVWDTVQNDLPKLVSALEKILPPEEK